MKPKITLALFNYNQAKYLPDSLGAILAQSDPPNEILLFDDASSDNSLEFLRKIPKAKFHFNEKNLGLFANIDKALETSENDFIVLTAADDILHPHFIAEHRKLLLRNRNLGLTCSDSVFFEDSEPRRYEVFRFLAKEDSQMFAPNETVNYLRETAFTLLSFTCVYNRHLIIKYGGYKKSLMSLADFYLNTQIALRHSIGYIPLPLAAARIVQNSYGEKFRRNFSERLKLYESLFDTVYNKENREFRDSFIRARLFSFGGLFSLCFILLKPKYWHLFSGLLAKNWKFHFAKIFSLIVGKPIQRLPTKPKVETWPKK